VLNKVETEITFIYSDLSTTTIAQVNNHSNPPETKQKKNMSKQTEPSSSNTAPTKEDTQPGLGILEDDDEFEEFVAQGPFSHVRASSWIANVC
jgi:hypothetical protein